MSPARPSVPAVLRVLGGRPLLLLLLLLSAPAVQGDCGLPPEVPNAQPVLEGLSTFPVQHTVRYKCNEGFVKVPGKPDSSLCQENNQWSEVKEFCNRSCNDPPRLLFASLEKTYSNQNYFPVNSTVDYQCRMGFRRERDLSATLTCLDNLEWSKPAEFCKKRACPNPGELQNGNVKIETDLLFGSSISFSCNTGYKLIGASSIYCVVKENSVGWSDRLPMCQEIFCPEPPKIENGMIKEEFNVYVYRQTVTYECNRGFTLVGQHSIYCDVENEEGVWSGPAPECRGRHVPPKPPPEVQESTTVPSAQKPTKVIVPATQSVPVPRATTRMYTTGTTKGKGSSPSGAANLISGHTWVTLTVLLVLLITVG
ncbi:complement decay-accelerating factor isoform X4 [Lepus europaeus]|uniref:complement decay-accelerating factor isoform X4 n=1 Tax=Lepus europaeus TaxID=9983 RepID=UPI002B483D20|nr:complement decay-accelerating factor isoform X4 [Lepus europaeus]